MDKGINLYLTKKFDYETLLDMFSKADFDCVIAPLDFVEKHKDKTRDVLKKYNLKLQMVHCTYDPDKLDKFWEDDKLGKELLDDYIRQIEIVKCLAPVDFVIHLVNTHGKHYSKIGEERLRLLVKKAKECGVRVCVENTFSAYQQRQIFANIKDENLQMCYDIGHENWLTPNDNLAEDLGEYIVQLHLHNNDGSFDQHGPIFEGSVNYENKAKDLVKVSNKLALCLELKFVDDRLSVDFLKSMKADLDKLEQMIKKYQTK